MSGFLRRDRRSGSPSTGYTASPAGRPHFVASHPRDQGIDDRGGPDLDRPLIDMSILVASVVARRNWLVAGAFIGALAGVAIALSTPKSYYAETSLFVDPREIRLTDDDLRNPILSTEAMLAMTDSQMAILSSTSVLNEVITQLDLRNDPEFNGNMNPGGISGGISVLKDLLFGSSDGGPTDIETLVNLRDALNVARDPKTFVINIGAKSRDPDKAARISNTIVTTYLRFEGNAQSGLMERTSDAIDQRLESLRADLNAAEQAVERYRAENDLVAVGAELIDDQQVVALSQQLSNARANKVAVRVKAEGLRRANVDDVINGAFPEEFLSANLIELRKQYSLAKSNADSLSSRLGPRHPQIIAAQSSLESSRSQIRSELRRIVASSQAELQRAVETEQELASQLAVARSRSLDNSGDLVMLRELERKAAATRQIYETFLKRSREASERGNLYTQNARIISPAEPPLRPSGMSRKSIALGGMILGFLAGLVIALLLGAAESIGRFIPGPYDGPGGSGRRPQEPHTPGHPEDRDAYGSRQTGQMPDPAPATPAAQQRDTAPPAVPAAARRERAAPAADVAKSSSTPPLASTIPEFSPPLLHLVAPERPATTAGETAHPTFSLREIVERAMREKGNELHSDADAPDSVPSREGNKQAEISVDGRAPLATPSKTRDAIRRESEPASSPPAASAGSAGQGTEDEISDHSDLDFTHVDLSHYADAPFAPAQSEATDAAPQPQQYSQLNPSLLTPGPQLHPAAFAGHAMQTPYAPAHAVPHAPMTPGPAPHFVHPAAFSAPHPFAIGYVVAPHPGLGGPWAYHPAAYVPVPVPSHANPHAGWSPSSAAVPGVDLPPMQPSAPTAPFGDAEPAAGAGIPGNAPASYQRRAPNGQSVRRAAQRMPFARDAQGQSVAYPPSGANPGSGAADQGREIATIREQMEALRRRIAHTARSA
ncbi:GumC family protein [Pseudohoeflea coraliihabitans]|uniref:Polysaccharide chain length determinant N-terminal domain-containing protein n=1 Tax=Pseudohoeflea coraliihabitans TaxID=2860393 RepID=A0ABS6WNK9_9HYPH|nr:GumC family protein [Pseudohoeflea sp. DP4N28-3]MBW3097340.1 hypothetical protein [Pseudohoeflea sp. DP4N28-3]